MAGNLSKLTRSVVLSVAVAAAAVVLTASPAHAQRARGGMGQNPAADMMSPGVTGRELVKIGEILSLNAEQKDAAEALLDAYQQEHAQVAKAMQEAMKNAQAEFMESQDPSVFTGELLDKTRTNQEKVKSLEAGFMNDLKALLDPKQAELWPKVERNHRRTKSLPSGMLAGESVNLITIADDVVDGERPKDLADAIESYEIELDRAMVERDARREKMQREQEESMKTFDFAKMDFTAIRKMMTETRKTGIKVRDINDRHARLIGGAIPAAGQADFAERVKKATFPQVYKEPHAAKAMEAALGFDDLTTEQKEAIERGRDGFTRDIAAANERWAAAIADEEKDGGGDPFGGFGRMVPGGGDEGKSAVEEAKRARRDLDKAALTKLKAILTEEQEARLPEREVDNPWANFAGGAGKDDVAESSGGKGRKEPKEKKKP